MPHFCLFKQPKMLALNYFLLAWFYCTKFLLCCIAAVHASMQPVAKKTRTEDSNCSVQSVDTSSTVLPRATQPDRHLSNSSDQHQQVWYGPGGVTHSGNPPATPAPQPKSLEPPIFVDVIARLPPTPPPARVPPPPVTAANPPEEERLEAGECEHADAFAAYDDIVLKPFTSRGNRVVVHAMERTSKYIADGFPFRTVSNSDPSPKRIKGVYKVTSIVRDVLHSRFFGRGHQRRIGTFAQYHSLVSLEPESVEGYLRHRRRYLGCFACELKRSGVCATCGCNVTHRVITDDDHLNNLIAYLERKREKAESGSTGCDTPVESDDEQAAEDEPQDKFDGLGRRLPPPRMDVTPTIRRGTSGWGLRGKLLRNVYPSG